MGKHTRPPCSGCGGSGKVYQTVYLDPKKGKTTQKLVTCPSCGGTGQR